MGRVYIYRNKQKIPVNLFPQHVPFHRTGKYQPIDPRYIVGVDTESFILQQDEMLHTVRVTIALADRDNPLVLDTTNERYPISTLFDTLWPMFKVKEINPSRTKQRKKHERPTSYYRDGRRQTVQPVALIFHNLDYDFGRLIRRHVQFSRAIQTGMDSVRVKLGGFEVEIDKLIIGGNAPNFEFFVRKDGYIMRLIGRDTWGYWKTSLEDAASSILGKHKEDFDSTIFEKLYEDLTIEEKELLDRYAAKDPLLTRELYTETMRLLRQINAHAINRQGLIPSSAPGAAARIAFSMAEPRNKEQEWYRPEDHLMQMGAWSVHGGRVIHLSNGYQDHVYVRDYSSAYPYAMTLLPDPATCEYQEIDGSIAYDHKRWRGRYGNLCVSGRGLQSQYPALFTHDEITGEYRPVNGPFQKVWASIPEIVIGVESGRLEIDSIHAGVELVGNNEASFLRSFVLQIYDIKQAHEKGSPMYLLAKLLLNSLNGKLLEIIHQPISMDQDLSNRSIPQLADIDKYATRILNAYTSGSSSTLEKILKEIEDRSTGDEPYIPISTLVDHYAYTAKPAKAGYYYLPIHASNVIGFTSARLGAAAYYTNAPNGHTDSLFTIGEQDDGLQKYYECVAHAGYPEPREGLGAFKLELEDAHGYIHSAGTYYLENDRGEVKYAYHAMPSINIPSHASAEEKDCIRREVVYDALKRQAEFGGQVIYRQRTRLLTTKESIYLGKEPGTALHQQGVLFPVMVKQDSDGSIRQASGDNTVDEEREEDYTLRVDHETLANEQRMARTPAEKLQWMSDSGWSHKKMAFEIECTDRAIRYIISGKTDGKRLEKKITIAFERRLSQLNADPEYAQCARMLRNEPPPQSTIDNTTKEGEGGNDLWINNADEDSYSIDLDDPITKWIMTGETPRFVEKLLDKYRESSDRAEQEYELFTSVEPLSFSEYLNKEVNILGCTVLPHPAYRSKADGTLHPGYESVYILLDEKDSNGQNIVLHTSSANVFAYMEASMQYKGWYRWKKSCRYLISKSAKTGAFYMQNVRSKKMKRSPAA